MTRDESARTLRDLAHHHRQASGSAFSQGNEEEARKHRDFADELTALATRAPELPVATRG